jgi:hypothetical protein
MLKKLFSLIAGSGTSPAFEPRMPEVDERSDIEAIFAQARSAATGAVAAPGASSGRHIVIVTPGRILKLQPCPPPGSMPVNQVQQIETIIPPTIKRNVAAIAYTELTALQSDAAKAIPFLGMLLGLAYIGHSVWVFEGHASALAAGCRDADVLLVDAAMVPHLAADWHRVAGGTMRHPEIYVHDRQSFSLRKQALG